MHGTDINKQIMQEEGLAGDPDGHLAELPPWSEQTAEQLAREAGVSLTDEHLEVLRFLRDRFSHEGQARSARQVIEALEKRFSERGGRRYLYQLFPGGPVTQGSQLAGLPQPAYSTDRSFGSSA